MGGPMCLRLVAAGHRVRAYDLDDDALATVVDAGAVAGSLGSGLRRGCRLPVDVAAHAAPRRGGDGRTWTEPSRPCGPVRCGSTSPPTTGSWCWSWPRRRPTAWPWSTHRSRAQWTVPDVGPSPCSRAANPDPVAAARDVLGCLGTVIECGPLGTGNVVKLVTNQLWFVTAAALGEGFAVGVANGVDLRTLWDAILNSVGDSFVARHDAPSIFAGHHDPSFPLSLCLKDLGLLAFLESSVGADLPMTAAARRAFEQAAERYGTGAGELCVARRIADDAGVSMRLDGDWVPHCGE